MWHWQYLHERHARAIVVNFQCIRQVASHCLIFSSYIQWQQTSHRGGGGRGWFSDDVTQGVATCRWRAVCGIKAGGKVCCLRLPCKLNCCYVDYKNDPYSENDPCSSICCRSDLKAHPLPYGCYDAKVCLSVCV